MTEPENMMLLPLRELRQEMRDIRNDVKTDLDGFGTKITSFEGSMKSYRHALTADTMMSKFITGDFEERIEALEKKVDQLLSAPH